MKYFKNTELAKLYNVSEKSVRNWIDAAEDGKLDLRLHVENGRSYVLNTTKNVQIVEQLVEKGRKYKNSRGYKSVKPLPKFYELYSAKQIFDIVSNLENYRELPRQYNYFDGGAEYWDRYAHRLAEEDNPNMITSTLRLLKINEGYIDDLLLKHKRVNVIDIGVGNALPVRPLITHLIEKGIFGRYIAVDISSEMIKIAEQNIRNWFNGMVNFEGHVLDINHDRFIDIVAEEYIKKDYKDVVNLVLVLGGTIGNFRSPDGALKVIHDSMGRNDLVIQTQKLDTEITRRYFDFNIDMQPQSLPPQYKFLVDLMNIDESFYDVEMGYDPDVRSRFLSLRLKVALSIKFEYDGGERVIDLNKDEKILLWRYWHQGALDVISQLAHNDFIPMLTSQTEDRAYILTVSQIKSE